MSRRLSGAGITTLPIRPAVVLVDMQTRFVDNLSPVKRDRIIKEQIKVIHFCAEMALPLFVLEYIGYGQTIDLLKSEIEYVHQVTLLLKDLNDAFSEPRLDAKLADLLVNELIITGINASSCVFATARTAFAQGYEITTASTLMADGDHILNDKSRSTVRDLEFVERWYRRNTTLYHSANKMLRDLREDLSKTVR